MHRDDLGMVERGDMFWNRGKGNPLVKAIAPVLFGFGKSERFTPDVYVNDGDDLSRYGLDARIVSLPGHSRGSIGIVTGKGDLFCGDLLINEKGPAVNFRIADAAAARASVEKIRRLGIQTVYTSHGPEFAAKAFFESQGK